MSIVDTLLSSNTLVLLFYVSIGILIYAKRHVFEFEGIIALYKTKYGLQKMEAWAKKYPKTLHYTGLIGIFVGYLFMILMTWLIAVSAVRVFTQPEAPPALAPVIPGVDIPGTAGYPPLIEGLIAIFVVVVIHEFAHGVICRLYDIHVKSSGFVLFGPLPGAFVEPDEEDLENAKWSHAQSMYAAGPWSNLLLGIPIFLLITGGAAMYADAYNDVGVQITGFPNETDERIASLSEGDILTQIENTSINNRFDLITTLQEQDPNTTVSIQVNGEQQTLLLGEGSRGNAYMGIFPQTVREPAESYASFITLAPGVFTWFFGDFAGMIQEPWQWILINPFGEGFTGSMGLFGWIFLITTGIAGANLLPVGPLDGGRMLYGSLAEILPEKTAITVTSFISWTIFLTVLLALLVPIGRALI